MEWRTIKGFENYMVSSSGLVKSIQRLVKRDNGTITHDKTINERILKPALTVNGYHFVTLRNDNKGYNKRIHTLVAENFIQERPEGLVINHIDSNKLNNNVENLEFVSHHKNTQHYFKTIGKSSPKIKMSEIPKIIRRIENGEKSYKIAREYNLFRNDLTILCKLIDISEELELK